MEGYQIVSQFGLSGRKAIVAELKRYARLNVELTTIITTLENRTYKDLASTLQDIDMLIASINLDKSY